MIAFSWDIFHALAIVGNAAPWHSCPREVYRPGQAQHLTPMNLGLRYVVPFTGHRNSVYDRRKKILYMGRPVKTAVNSSIKAEPSETSFNIQLLYLLFIACHIF